MKDKYKEYLEYCKELFIMPIQYHLFDEQQYKSAKNLIKRKCTANRKKSII